MTGIILELPYKKEGLRFRQHCVKISQKQWQAQIKAQYRLTNVGKEPASAERCCKTSCIAGEGRGVMRNMGRRQTRQGRKCQDKNVLKTKE